MFNQYDTQCLKEIEVKGGEILGDMKMAVDAFAICLEDYRKENELDWNMNETLDRCVLDSGERIKALMEFIKFEYVRENYTGQKMSLEDLVERRRMENWEILENVKELRFIVTGGGLYTVPDLSQFTPFEKKVWAFAMFLSESVREFGALIDKYEGQAK